MSMMSVMRLLLVMHVSVMAKECAGLHVAGNAVADAGGGRIGSIDWQGNHQQEKNEHSHLDDYSRSTADNHGRRGRANIWKAIRSM
jgi:hypothetical protein